MNDIGGRAGGTIKGRDEQNYIRPLAKFSWPRIRTRWRGKREKGFRTLRRLRTNR